jgi:hypothetical protein
MSDRAIKLVQIAGCCGAIVFGVGALIAALVLDGVVYRVTRVRVAQLEGLHLLAALVSLAGLGCAATAVWLTPRDPPAYSKSFIVWFSPILPAVALGLLALDLKNSGVHSAPSALNECMSNRRSVDRAKERWALRTGASSGTDVAWGTIAGEFPGGFPVCPEGGSYNLGHIGEDVTCSNPQHGRVSTK